MSKNKSEIIIEAFEKAWTDANGIKMPNGYPPRFFGVPAGLTKDEAKNRYIVSMYEKLQFDPAYYDDSPLFKSLYKKGITYDDIMHALRIEFIVETI